MVTETVQTHNFDIYIAGDIDTARQVCREYCMEVGMCVNVQPIEYIYTGGSETGIRVGFINYPRFPLPMDELSDCAVMLANKLMKTLCQHSYTIVGPDTTTWKSRRPST